MNRIAFLYSRRFLGKMRNISYQTDRKTKPELEYFALLFCSGLIFIFGLYSCSKDDDTYKLKENVTAIAVNFQLRTNASGELRGIVGVYPGANGISKSISVEIGPDALLKNGITSILKTDIVSDLSQIIASGVAGTAAFNNPTTPNTFHFYLEKNADFSSIALHIDSTTRFYLHGKDVYTTYNLHQLDSAFRAVATQVPLLNSNIQVQ